MSSVEENQSQQVPKAAGGTRINLIKFQYEWTIFNFISSKRTVGACLRSPTFSMGSQNEYCWQLEVYPFGVKSSSYQQHHYLGVHLLNCRKRNDDDCTARFTFSISNGKKEKSTVARPYSGEFTFIGTSNTLAADHFIERTILDAPKNELLPNGNLTLVCDITVIEDGFWENTFSIRSPQRQKSQSLDVFNDLFKSSKFYDVTLVACGREFPAHKAILAVRSSVFSAMFEHEMKEQKDNRVDITDVDGDVLNEMLQFIYTGISTNLDKMAESLLAAADKYQIDELKSLCIEKLRNRVSIDNAATSLIMADRYHAVEFKEYIQNFISRHRKEVSKTEDFKSTFSTHQDLIMEALTS